MDKTKKTKLLEYLREIGKENPQRFIYLQIDNSEMCHLETIMFKGQDANYKAVYIANAYDDNLCLKAAPHIRIVGWE